MDSLVAPHRQDFAAQAAFQLGLAPAGRYQGVVAWLGRGAGGALHAMERFGHPEVGALGVLAEVDVEPLVGGRGPMA